MERAKRGPVKSCWSGRNKAFNFLPWHLGFLHRYRPFPELSFGATSAELPLLGRRWSLAVEGEKLEELSPLERLLRCEHEDAHVAMANALWRSPSHEDAAAALEELAGSQLEGWEASTGSRELDGTATEG